MERQLISIQHSRHLKCLWLLLSCSFLAQSEPSIEFFVSIPDDRELIKYTTADVVLNERFKMICKFSDLQTAGSCDQLWIYGVPHDKLVKMTKTGEGSISENYLEAAQNNMNPTFEVLDTGMRIELDVHKATKALFKYDTYTCRCVNIQTAITTIQLKLHEQSAPKNLKVLQNPAPPYLEEQKVNLSCSAEAWPTKTTFRILANQKVLFEEEVSNSQTGIQHEISIDDSIHQKVECEAKNKMGTNRKLYDMIIHAKPELSMLRIPANDIREDTPVEISCHALAADETYITDLSLFEEDELLRSAQKSPFEIVYKKVFTRDMQLVTYKCVLKSKHYPDLTQSRIVSTVYGPLISLNSSAIVQVQQTDYVTLVCVIEASPNLLYGLTDICSWKSDPATLPALGLGRVVGESHVQLTASLNANYLSAGTYAFSCDCDSDFAQKLTPNQVSVSVFYTPSLLLETSLDHGCYENSTFDLACRTDNVLETKNLTLSLNGLFVGMSEGKSISYSENANLVTANEEELEYSCALTYMSGFTEKSISKSIVLPKCELRITGLEDEYVFEVHDIPTALFFNATIEASGMLSYFKVTWISNGVVHSTPVRKTSSSHVYSTFLLSDITLDMHNYDIVVEIDAEGYQVQRSQSKILFWMKASFFESFDVQSDIGSTAKLRWNLAAFPFPEQRDMKLIKDGSEIDYRQPPYSYTMTSINATAGSFEVKCPVNSASNYGKYTLQVSNSAGVTEYTLLLNHTVRPLLPIAFEFDPISPEEARLFFHVRDENYGGTTNYFQIKTWDLKSLNPEPSELKLDASEDKTDYSVTLTGLQLFGEYQTQLRACNYNGLCSPWSDELLLNLSNPLQFRQNTSNASKASAVLTSFFIVIGVCVVLLLAAALFIAHKKYRERRLKEERIASRNADGFATMPSRTVTRVPPPSPGRSYTTLDWSNSYRPVLEFENFHSNTLPKDFSDAEIQTQKDPELQAHIDKQNRQPLLSKESSEDVETPSGGKLSVGSNADTNGYPFMSARSGDSFVTFQGDNEELPPSPPPIAMVDDEFGEDSAYSHVHHRPSSQPPPVVTRVSRYGNI